MSGAYAPAHMNRSRSLRSLRSYYEWLSKYGTSPYDSYNKPWRSSVTVGECAGAKALGDVVPKGDELEIGPRARGPVPASFVPAMGHKFSPLLDCHHCRLSWEDHQETKSPCRGYGLPQYVEPQAAPQESEAERRERVDRFSELYPDPQPRTEK